MNNFGGKVAQLRKAKGMTQAELAMQLNVSNRAVSRWETGEGYPEVTLLAPLAKALGVSVDFLLGEEAEWMPPESEEQEPQPEEEKRTRWQRLNIFNKIASVVFLAQIIVMLLICAEVLVSTDSENAGWFPLLVMFNAVFFTYVPWLGSGSALIGLIAGGLGKCSRQIKTGLILLVINILPCILILGFVWLIC